MIFYGVLNGENESRFRYDTTDVVNDSDLEEMLPHSYEEGSRNRISKNPTHFAECEPNADNDVHSKSFTVQDAVEQLGFGWFQLRMLFICGILTASDAMEMLLLSVLGPALRCAWSLSSQQVAFITTVVFMGMIMGAPFWGRISDKYGRWTTFFIVILLISYFGFLTTFSPTYGWVVFLRGMVGFSIGGAASSFTLITEYLPQKYRAKILIIYNISWALGSSFEIGLTYLVLPRWGWRYLVACSSIPLILFSLIMKFLPESARYLVAAGREKEARKVLDQMARMNKRPPLQGKLIVPPITPQDQGKLGDLFHVNYRRTTALLLPMWFGVAFCYYGIILLSAEIFNFHRDCFGIQRLVQVAHNVSEKVEDTSCCQSLTNSDYVAMLISSFGEFIIIPINLITIDKYGRRFTLIYNWLVASVFFGLLYLCMPESVTTGVLFVIRAFVSGIFNVVYIYTSEVYPTTVRSLGLGICSACARLGCMSTPFVAQVIMPDVSVLAAFVIYSMVALMGACCSFFLSIETRGRGMPQSVVSFQVVNEEIGMMREAVVSSTSTRVQDDS